jgi:hypothetical protein
VAALVVRSVAKDAAGSAPLSRRGSVSPNEVAALLTLAGVAAPFAAESGSRGQTVSLLVVPDVLATSQVAANAAETPQPALPPSSSPGTLDRLFANLLGIRRADALGTESWWNLLG